MEDTTTTAPPSETGISPAQKAIERLSSSIESGDLYQALQLFKTQHARAKKKGDIATASELAFRGANLMLEKNQVNAGGELARDFIDLNKESKDYDLIITQLLVIDSNFNKLDFENVEVSRERQRFLKQALEFSQTTWPQGDPQLHLNFARFSLKQKNLQEASFHYLHSQQMDEFASVLITWANNGPKEERDLYLGRACLQLLCFENLRDANALYSKMRKELPDLDTPLVRYIGFLLRTLERDAFPLFQLLKQKYSQSLSRVILPNGQNQFEAYLEKIAQVFYGIQPQSKSGFGGMMESLMKGLF